jgi:hypothetical protein
MLSFPDHTAHPTKLFRRQPCSTEMPAEKLNRSQSFFPQHAVSGRHRKGLSKMS